MKCPYCLGTSFQRGRFDLAQVVKLQPVLMRNVPAYRCRQCGYLQVSGATMKRIEKLMGEGLPDTVVPTAVYDLASPSRAITIGRTSPLSVATDATMVAA